MDEIYGRKSGGSSETPDRIANMRNPLSLADIVKRSKPSTTVPPSGGQRALSSSQKGNDSLQSPLLHYLGPSDPRRGPPEEPTAADYCDYLMETLQLTRLGTNCNKLLFDGADLNAEIMQLEARNYELEEEVGLLQSAAEMREAEVKRGVDEVALLKGQLEETIAAADKCIEELEEQVRKYEEDKFATRSSLDRRAVELEDQLRKVKDDKAAVEGRLVEADLEVKRHREEVAAQAARLNFSKVEADGRVGLLEDRLRAANDEYAALKARLDAAVAAREAAERQGAELKAQLARQGEEVAAARGREAEAAAARDLLQRRVTDLEAQGRADREEIDAQARRLREVDAAKASALQGLDAERRRDQEEVARLGAAVADAKAAQAAAEVQAAAQAEQLRVAVAEVAQVARKANEAKAASDAFIADLEARNKQLRDALTERENDLTQTSATKVNNDILLAELRGSLKKATDSLAATEAELKKVTTAKIAAEKALAETQGERQKLIDVHAQRARELDTASRAARLEADAHVGELKAQLRKADEDLLQRTKQLADMATEKAAADRRAVDGEARVALLQQETKIVRDKLEELLAKQAAEDRKDKRRVADLREVNDTLLQIARNRRIQELLKTAKVKVALACWGGSSAAQQLTEAELESVRTDPGVIELFPKLKEFESVCDRAKIRFPVDHIEAGWTELSEDAVTYAFGPDFVALHHVELRFNLNKSPGGPSSSSKKS